MEDQPAEKSNSLEKPTPSAAPNPPISTPPPENISAPAPKPSLLKQIRTFQGDVAEALTRQQESLVSIQQTAYEKRRLNPEASISEEEIDRKRRHLIWLSLGSFFFIVLGLIGGSYSYNEYKRRTASPILSVPANRFISTTKETSIDLSAITFSREALLSAFEKETEDLAAGELKHVVLRKGQGNEAPLLKTSELFALLESRALGSLVRAFNNLFMLGAYNDGALGERPSRFIVIKLDSFENAFPGMLAWETYLAEDIGPLLATPLSLQAVGPTNVFKDVIVKNKDLRILEGGDSATSTRPVLVYSFFDNNMLVITDKLNTLEMVLDRLTRAKLSR